MKTEAIIALTERYVMNTYKRLPVAFVRGEGCYLWDAEGKKYLDLLAGIAVNGLGHSHPEIVEAVTRQVRTLVHTSNLFHVKPQAELAQMLCENSFAGKVFFANSGAEANEAAVKLARRYGKVHKGEACYEVITVTKSFHGRTLAMVAATGQKKVQQGFDPLPEGFLNIPFNDIDALKAAVGPKTCAVMLEPVLGEGGVLLHAPGYLQAVRKICDDMNILLIFDEIQTGLGRTGRLFAHELSGVIPDVLTLAKSLGAGLPVGACLAKDSVASALGPGEHASTFGGNFLVCEAAKKFLHIILEKGFLGTVNDTGAHFLNRLLELKSRFPVIQEVRGIGLMIGMDLSIPGQPLVVQALKKGLVINCVQEKTLRFLPPLIITPREIDDGIKILTEVFAEAEKGTGL